jgi:uncharacterized protein (TIGR02246 family)
MRIMTPEDGHRAFTAAFNAGDVDGILALYEPNAVVVLAPGQTADGLDAIRSALTNFLGLKLPIDMRVGTATATGDIALLSSPWTITGADPGGSPVNLSGTTADVLRRQTDGTWRFVIDSPFGGTPNP